MLKLRFVAVSIKRMGLMAEMDSRYRQQRRGERTVSVRPIPGRQPLLSADQYPELRSRVTAMTDATLIDHCQ